MAAVELALEIDRPAAAINPQSRCKIATEIALQPNRRHRDSGFTAIGGYSVGMGGHWLGELCDTN